MKEANASLEKKVMVSIESKRLNNAKTLPLNNLRQVRLNVRYAILRFTSGQGRQGDNPSRFCTSSNGITPTTLWYSALQLRGQILTSLSSAHLTRE